MHGSKLPLPVWFWAYLMVTHSNGISALQLLRQLGLGSYKTAWLLCAKLRRAMVAPDRNLVGTTPAGCASRRSPTSPQSAARLRQGQCRRRGNRKTDGWSGYVLASWMSATTPTVARWPPCAVSSPTSSTGRWASITDSAGNTCHPTSTNSSSASTVARADAPPFDLCSVSVKPSAPSPTICRSNRKQRIRLHCARLIIVQPVLRRIKPRNKHW
jgi:hypothetical protein